VTWPAEAGSLGLITAPAKRGRRRRPPASRVLSPAALRGKYYLDASGKYRVWNSPGYRFYRSNSGEPTVGDLFDSNATLPHEPTDTYADGTWYLAVSYFNGVIDSGFLPIGPRGESYLRMDLASGAVIDAPPWGPDDFRLLAKPSGVVQVVGLSLQAGDLAPDQWAIAYTTNGSTPAEDSPDVVQTISHQVLAYDLPAQSHGTTVKVRLQTRRDDGSWRYSEDSEVLTITAVATGPETPPAGD